MAKSAKKSKTVWFNILMIVTVAVVELTPVVDELPKEWQQPASLALVVVACLANLGLRFVTKEGIKWPWQTS